MRSGKDGLMLSDKVRHRLCRLAGSNGGKVLFDEPLQKHSTISIGGPAYALYMPSTLEELVELSSYLRSEDLRSLVLGNGSNVLMPDDGIKGVVIVLGDGCCGEKVFTGSDVTAGAGVKLGSLLPDCCTRGLSGLEGLAGIPATVGGAIMRNASYRSAISDRLVRVRMLDRDGKIRWVDRKDITFRYRERVFAKDEIILEGSFRLEKRSPEAVRETMKGYLGEKMNSQPCDERTLGCVFKNPADSKYRSWELIDMCGMRGRSRGGARVSEKHANFIVNAGGATSRDVIALMDDIRGAVKERFSVELEPEIEIL